jgi:hypothetical protein
MEHISAVQNPLLTATPGTNTGFTAVYHFNVKRSFDFTSLKP